MKGEGRVIPALTFYGDSFTGSTDALEALASNGVASVLFLDMPDAARLKEFSHAAAIGVAGESRKRSPEWMSSHLPVIFKKLRAMKAPICQYKIGATFDSGPRVGSIGRALEIGKEVFGAAFVPIVPAAPHLKRYVLFSNLFAGAEEGIHRIDRHPTMSRHPATPMDESDLRLHLAKQTAGKLKSFDMLALSSLDADSHLDALLEDNPAGVIFDGASREALRKTAEMIWKRRPEACFVVGSSGFTHGMAVYWRGTGLVKMAYDFSDPGPVNRLIVMASSVSGVTERQICWALAHGFEGIHIDAAALCDGESAEAARGALLKLALRHLKAGKSVVLHRAPWPAGGKDTAHQEEFGVQLGKLLRELLAQSGVKRAVVAGAEVASHAARELGIYALTMLAPIAPGAPLCRAYGGEGGSNGLELVFKGGHIGAKDFFGAVRAGRSG
jgi:3-oxoisoapionate kinase